VLLELHISQSKHAHSDYIRCRVFAALDPLFKSLTHRTLQSPHDYQTITYTFYLRYGPRSIRHNWGTKAQASAKAEIALSCSNDKTHRSRLLKELALWKATTYTKHSRQKQECWQGGLTHLLNRNDFLYLGRPRSRTCRAPLMQATNPLHRAGHPPNPHSILRKSSPKLHHFLLHLGLIFFQLFNYPVQLPTVPMSVLGDHLCIITGVHLSGFHLDTILSLYNKAG
jgi:hypothetical protein